MDAIKRNCGIRKASKDKIPRNPLVAGAWRAQVHWVDYALRVFLIFVYSNLFTSGLISAWRAAERFFAKYFNFLFDNTFRCYLVLSSLFPTL